MSFILEGFRIGLPQFGIGGTGTFYIPSSLGYGSTAPVGVRPDAVLIYDFELIDVDYKIEKPYRDSLESKLIENYLISNELTSFVTTEGIHIVFENEGSEEKPTVNSTVTVDYRGTLLNGDIFDSSYERGTPSTFSLQNVIEGWKIGIPYFGRGGKGKLIIPYRYAYGINGSNNIPPFSALIFDIEVYDF
jgi:FKBP-type peptidyl-prolyl cis-trans isomerase